jgi:hypothetical protein
MRWERWRTLISKMSHSRVLLDDECRLFQLNLFSLRCYAYRCLEPQVRAKEQSARARAVTLTL